MTEKQMISTLKELTFGTVVGSKGVEALEMAIPALLQEPKSPCDVCIYNPPSSTDGKPCTMCPATGRSKE